MINFTLSGYTNARETVQPNLKNTGRTTRTDYLCLRQPHFLPPFKPDRRHRRPPFGGYAPFSIATRDTTIEATPQQENAAGGGTDLSGGRPEPNVEPEAARKLEPLGGRSHRVRRSGIENSKEARTLRGHREERGRQTRPIAIRELSVGEWFTALRPITM